MEILLSQEQQTSLEQGIYKLVTETVNKAREDSSINSKQYMRKKELCTYLSVSYNTLNKLIYEGLPQINVRGLVRFNKSQVDQWMIEHNQ